ncbi:MAG: DegQ family serine endoprotease [Burkholderiales bacterium]|nr:DegQ family serine endoprotease [Burkholderiales bacterium]
MTRSWIAAGLLAAGFVAGAGIAVLQPDFLGEISRPAHAAAASGPQSGVSPTLLPDFTSIVERNGPAVVNISVVQETQPAADLPQLQPGDPFFEFFRRFGVPMPQNRMPVRGMGSGFIINPDGLVLTNAHVVASAKEVTVKLTDKREFRAKVLGVDKATDVALLKIDATNLPSVRIGNTTDLKVGEWVTAIGSPYGFENTVTSGIVSAKWRSLPDGAYVPFIQTDVAVNPGNSGGPLFNMKGEVIGINSQIYSRTGGYQGLSFAIPIEVAIKVKDQLQQYGKVTRGHLGVTIQELNQSLAESFGLRQADGALVTAVTPNSPAQKAGVQPGDVILGFNGKSIRSSAELPLAVGDVRPGESAKMRIWRKGKEQSLTVVVGATPQAAVAQAPDPAQTEQPRLGVSVRPLTPEEGKQTGLRSGLVVEQATGPAAAAGIAPGDVILSVNGTPVTNSAELREQIQKAGKHAALLVQRNTGADRATVFVPVELG